MSTIQKPKSLFFYYLCSSLSPSCTFCILSVGLHQVSLGTDGVQTALSPYVLKQRLATFGLRAGFGLPSDFIWFMKAS